MTNDEFKKQIQVYLEDKSRECSEVKFQEEIEGIIPLTFTSKKGLQGVIDLLLEPNWDGWVLRMLKENTEKGPFNGHYYRAQFANVTGSIKKERDEYLDGWKRAKADLANYKKEEAERLESFAKFSNEALILEMLQVLDSFELGLTMIKEDDPAWKGVVLIQGQLQDILKRHGLQRIEVKKGDPLDTNLHEAIEEINSDAPPGTISEEIAAGYKLHGKTIRPARVKVSKK